jgi:hypothetical protein
MGTPFEMAAGAQQVAKFRSLTVHIPGEAPIEIPGSRVTGYVAQPGMPTLAGWIDEMGRPHQVMGAVVHAIFEEPSKLFAPGPRLAG